MHKRTVVAHQILVPTAIPFCIYLLDSRTKHPAHLQRGFPAYSGSSLCSMMLRHVPTTTAPRPLGRDYRDRVATCVIHESGQRVRGTIAALVLSSPPTQTQTQLSTDRSPLTCPRIKYAARCKKTQKAKNKALKAMGEERAPAVRARYVARDMVNTGTDRTRLQKQQWKPANKGKETNPEDKDPDESSSGKEDRPAKEVEEDKEEDDDEQADGAVDVDVPSEADTPEHVS